MLRRETDERQAYRRLQIQALVGGDTTGAAAVTFLAAFADRATMWPFLIPSASQATRPRPDPGTLSVSRKLAWRIWPAR